MAEKGILSEEQHTWSLFWLVKRISEDNLANLQFESATLEQDVKVSLLCAKKRKVTTTSWSTSELPTIPVLVNKKAIEKHTMLCVFQPEKKKLSKKDE